MNNIQQMSWSFFQIANDAAIRPNYPVKPRDYLWATDLGNAPVDVYLKMMGEQFTNPANDRSMRKFHAGDVWEFYAYLVLYFAGVLRASQDHMVFQYPGLLKVTGRWDFLAGGKPDWTKARETIKLFPMTDVISDYFQRMIDKFEAQFGSQELKEIIIECKSVSSFMFPRYQKTQRGSIGNEIQLFHYEKSQGKDEGHIVYINKDDSEMLEFPVWNPGNGEIEAEYKKRIELLTHYYNAKEQPPLEKEIIFDEDTYRFNKNWKIEYSPYLTKLYGYQTPEAYRERWDRVVGQFNRVLGRIINVDMGKTTPSGKPIVITPDNQKVIDEMHGYFDNADDIIQKVKNDAKAHPELAEVVESEAI